MAQTSYSINIPAVAFPGQLAGSAKNRDATSAMAVAAAIVYGTLVVRDTANTSSSGVAGKAPALAADITTVGSALGVALADQGRPQDPSVANPQYPVGSAVSCLRQGRVWVLVEETVAAGDLPFVRFAAGGGGTVLGAFRKSADTASAAQLPGAVYVVGASAGGYAQVELNLV